MQQFSSRERLGVVAAGAVVLFLGAGGWAFSHASVPAATRPSLAAATLRPMAGSGVPAALEIAAGGAAASATPAPNAATTAAISTAPAGSAGGGTAIFVHVAGAVKTPGVYKFQPGDRINDAVKAAGGFKAGADRDALNLADTLQDADQIFIPAADSAPAANNGKTTGAASSAAVITDGPALAPGASTVRKSRSRRASHPLITPGIAPARTQSAVVVGPLPAPSQPGDVVVQPLPAPGEADKVAAIETKVAAIETKVARRGRVIGRPAPVLAQPAAGDASEEGDDAGAPAIAASVVSRTARGSARKSSAIVGGVSKKGSATKGGAGKSAKFKNPGDGFVHLNSATAEQLEKLPGVGPAMSGRIVEYRTEIGKFTDPSQLMDVKGIGDKKYAKMQPFLML